jgi:hypothetical protein
MVVVTSPRTPSYVIRYKGLNYIDYNLSDDYSMMGVKGIPGVRSMRVRGDLSLDTLARVLEPYRGVVQFYHSNLTGSTHPMVILHPELGAVEVIVNPNADLSSVSKPIAVSLEPILSEHGYHTVVIVRGFSNASLNKLIKAFNEFSKILMGLIETDPPDDTPMYLRRIIELQKKAYEKHQMKSYMSVSIGIYGTVGIDFWGPKPNKTEVYNLVKWLRDKAGHEYSNIPLYIIFHSEPPPQGNGLLVTASNNTFTKQNPVHPIRLSGYNNILAVAGLIIALLASAILFFVKH